MQLVGYCRYGRSKVVEVFRHLRDGDPVEIENRRTSVALPIIWLYSQCLQALLLPVYSWPARRCLSKGDYAKRFSPAPSTVCGDGQWSVSCRLLAFIGTEKKPLELRLPSVVKTISASDFFLFQSWQPVC